MITDTVSKHAKFAFYGAQTVAYGAYVAIKHLIGRAPECFIVSSSDGNPGEIEGLPVVNIEKVSPDTLIIIAATELLHAEISEILHSSGHRHSFSLTAREEHSLMSAYYESIGSFPLAAEASSRHPDFTMFEVRHHNDKPLKGHPRLEAWEVPIQAGAELTDVRICEKPDNTGDNISAGNRQYCEGTAMYWVWKNAPAAWVGIEHYRRHLLVRPDMLCDEIDAILPLPYICFPNVQAQFLRFVNEDTVNALKSALRALYPGEYGDYVQCLHGKYHYAYNLIAAKSGVFADYCKWAWKVTDYIESLGIKSINESRALAYILEMLTSIYFITNKSGLKIRHAEKAIYT